MKTIVEQIVKHYPSKYEVDLLKQRITREPGMTLSKLAKQMNMTYVTLWRKLHNEKGFFLYDLELRFLLEQRWLTIETKEVMSKGNKKGGK